MPVTRLQVEGTDLAYEGGFAKPAFSILDNPGTVCELLLEVLAPFGCTAADLTLDDDGEPGDRGVSCDVDDLDASVTVRGDRVELRVSEFAPDSAQAAASILDTIWSGLAAINARAVPKNHSVLFEINAAIRDSSYQRVLERFAPVPPVFPGGTESALVYYLPADSSRGYGESSVVLNRSAVVEHGLQISATLVYEDQELKPAAVISVAQAQLAELLRNLEVELSGA